MTNFDLNDNTTIPVTGFGVFMVPNNGPTEEAVTIALKEGYRLIDTAQAYMNEEAVGRGVKKAIEDNKEEFLNRVFTQSEIEYCEKRKNAKYQHYAARFASKEAIFKAIAGAFENKYELSWKDAEVINDETGKPCVRFLNNKPEELESIDISISHCKEYAVAYVIVTWLEK
mgnify:CR=1 FL=1